MNIILDDTPAIDKIEKNKYQAELLERRLIKRFKHLGKWARRSGNEAWLLYDRDIPEVPLRIEIYKDYISGALYERPYDKPEEEERIWLAAMTDATARATGVDPAKIFLKLRKRQKGMDQYSRFDSKSCIVQVHEHDRLFKVNVSDYLDTGLFTDHRLTRKLVSQEVSNKRLLNLFSYTSSFSVHAAASGAASTDSVDISKNYLLWSQENFNLNALDAVLLRAEEFHSPQQAGCQNRLIRADALRFVSEAKKKGLFWDHIILDPPTFSNSSKMEGNLDIKRDHPQILNDCLSLLAPGGTLWFSTNAKGFSLQLESTETLIIQDIQRTTIDEDYRGHSNRKCWTLRIPK